MKQYHLRAIKTDKRLYMDVGKNDVFHRRITSAAHPRTGPAWCEYMRYDGVRCRCISQHNYGNTRAVGGLYSISPRESVWVIHRPS